MDGTNAGDNGLTFLDEEEDDFFTRSHLDDSLKLLFANEESEEDDFFKVHYVLPVTDKKTLTVVTSKPSTDDKRIVESLSSHSSDSGTESEDTSGFGHQTFGPVLLSEGDVVKEERRAIEIAGLDLLVSLSKEEKENQILFYYQVYTWKYQSEIGDWDSEEEWSGRAWEIIEEFLLPTAPHPIFNIMLDVNETVEYSENMFDELLKIAAHTIIIDFCPIYFEKRDMSMLDDLHFENRDMSMLDEQPVQDMYTDSNTAEKVGHETINKVVYYYLRIFNFGEPVCTCTMRYSHLRDFHMKHQLTKVHTFPPKSLRKNKEFVAGRTEKLNDYFAAIGKEERISSDHRLLKYFLDYYEKQKLNVETKKSAEAVMDFL